MRPVADSSMWALEALDRAIDVAVEQAVDDAEVLLDGRLDPLLGEEVVHPHDPDAFVDGGEHLGEGRVAAGEREADVEVLVDEHEFRVGVFGGVVLECHPVAAEIEQRRAVVGHRRRCRRPTVRRTAVSSSDLRTSYSSAMRSMSGNAGSKPPSG